MFAPARMLAITLTAASLAFVATPSVAQSVSAGARLTGTTWSQPTGASLTGASLTGASLTGASLS